MGGRKEWAEVSRWGCGTVSNVYEYIMKCGCVAFAYSVNRETGEHTPCCFTHSGVIDAVGDDIGKTIMRKQPNLDGRMAECAYGCGSMKPSSVKLAFFEYRGPDSPDSKRKCKHCAYHDVAHGKGNPHVCDHFEPHGPFEFDKYYCGCRGWD